MALTGEENNSLVFTITKDTRLRWFQYRIFQIILPTNRFLFDTKLVQFVASAMSRLKIICIYFITVLVFRKVVRMEKSRH